PVHLEFFGTLEKIAEAKAEIFLGVEPGGTAVLNRDNAQFDQLARAAKTAGVGCVVSFGEHAQPDARLIKCALKEECSCVEANILRAAGHHEMRATRRPLCV